MIALTYYTGQCIGRVDHSKPSVRPFFHGFMHGAHGDAVILVTYRAVANWQPCWSDEEITTYLNGRQDGEAQDVFRLSDNERDRAILYALRGYDPCDWD